MRGRSETGARKSAGPRIVAAKAGGRLFATPVRFAVSRYLLAAGPARRTERSRRAALDVTGVPEAVEQDDRRPITTEPRVPTRAVGMDGRAGKRCHGMRICSPGHRKRSIEAFAARRVRNFRSSLS